VCQGSIDVDEEDVDEGDSLSCDECGADLKVVSTGPLELESAEELKEEEEGFVEEDEEVQAVTDRNFWETERGTKQTVAMADELFSLIKSIDPGLELKYNKFYIGLATNGQPNNFVIFRPRKHGINIDVKLPQSAEVDQLFEQAGLDVMDYDKKWGNYRCRLSQEEIKKNQEALNLIIKNQEKILAAIRK